MLQNHAVFPTDCPSATAFSGGERGNRPAVKRLGIVRKTVPGRIKGRARGVNIKQTTLPLASTRGLPATS